jgi:predicted amidophosphoribosyltransferase
LERVAWRALLDVVFPAQCAGCNALGSGLCAACAPRGGPIRIRLPALRVTACGLYEGTLRSAVLALKDGRRDVGEALGRIAARLIPAGSAIVPVPTTARRRRVRGFDGVTLIARIAAELAGATVAPALEQRRGDAQRGRSRVARLAARGRFACDAAAVASRRVLLLDDVCTTGATLRDCAEAVRRAGGAVEDAVVVAVTKTAAPWEPPIEG